jgi:DUF4097 and DUF4098 domain-containing protein YvlB
MGQFNRLVGFSLLAAALPLAAQESWCSAHSFHSDGMVSHVEVREERLAAAAENTVNPAQNGSIHVHGSPNSDIQVKACVQTAALDESEAEALAKQVTITDGPGRVVAKGPTANDKAWWSVSYEVWAPSSANLRLEAFNGSIAVEGMASQIRAHTLNGSLKMKDVGGDVEGETTNGSLMVDLSGNGWQGKGLTLNTVNGSIHLHVPASISADVEASTVHGRVRSDFATDGVSEDRSNVRFTLGSGGPKIEARTINGSVQISRQN